MFSHPSPADRLWSPGAGDGPAARRSMSAVGGGDAEGRVQFHLDVGLGELT
jgi:hypothetical protein